MLHALIAFLVQISWAGSPPSLEDVGGNIVSTHGAAAYVYSDRSGARDASLAGAALKQSVAGRVVAIADVRGLGFWPISTIVREAVTSQGNKDGAPILLDWTGTWGNIMGLPAGGCSVVIMDGESISRTSSCSVAISGDVRIK